MMIGGVMRQGEAFVLNEWALTELLSCPACFLLNHPTWVSCKANNNKHHFTNLPCEMRMLRITSHIVAIISFSHFYRSSLITSSHVDQTKSLLSHTNLPHTPLPPHTPSFCTNATPCAPIGHSHGSALNPAALSNT